MPIRRHLHLDVIRCLAILLVLGAHITKCPPEAGQFLHGLFSAINRGGWIGVDLFFVLSGYLVAGLLFKEYLQEGTVHCGRFLIRRGFKIYPPFWVMIGASVSYRLLKDYPVQPSQVIGELLFVQNYVPGLWIHTWSLAIEEHFYLLLAAIFAWSVHTTAKKGQGELAFNVLPVVVPVIALACLAARMWTTHSVPYDFYLHMAPTHLRIDSLFFGALLAWAVHVGPLKNLNLSNGRRVAMLFTAALLGSLAFSFDHSTHGWIRVFGVTLFALGAALMVLSGHNTDLSRVGLARWAAALGRYSYSIYLWHPLVMRWIAPRFIRLAPDAGWGWVVSIEIASSLAIGILMSRIIEIPTLALRDLWFPSRVRSAPNPAWKTTLTAH